MVKDEIIAVQLSKGLRKELKIICTQKGITMRSAIVDEINNILNNNEPMYNCPTPDQSERCNLMIHMHYELLSTIREKRRNEINFRIRNLCITAIINFISKNESKYDFQKDIEE